MAPRGNTLPQAATESAREARKSFFCDLCGKGYARATEYESHLDSYDHNHRQRMKDMTRLTRDSGASSRRDEDAASGLTKISLPLKDMAAANKKKPVFKSVTSKKVVDPSAAPAATPATDTATTAANTATTAESAANTDTAKSAKTPGAPKAASTATTATAVAEKGDAKELASDDDSGSDACDSDDPDGAIANGWADEAYDPSKPSMGPGEMNTLMATRGLVFTENGLEWGPAPEVSNKKKKN